MVAPSLWAATVFSTAGGRSERLIFFSWAEAVPASSSPQVANATNRFTFMFSPERGDRPPLSQTYALVSKHRINASDRLAPATSSVISGTGCRQGHAGDIPQSDRRSWKPGDGPRCAHA